jgi:REP element-mobilizing transposase RayT
MATRGGVRHNAAVSVYLHTWHAHRSWNADNPRGYVRRGTGILPPDPEMARNYNRAATQQRLIFTDDLQRVLIDGCRDICGRRNWRLHQVIAVSSHVHALISCKDEAVTWEHVRDTLKRLLGWMLAKHTGLKGQHWFARKGSRKRVRDREHFNHLMQRYLPDHANGRRGGTGWREDIGYFGRAFAGR